jgi:hypothetical protein
MRNERRSIHHQKISYIVTTTLPHQYYSFIPICNHEVDLTAHPSEKVRSGDARRQMMGFFLGMVQKCSKISVALAVRPQLSWIERLPSKQQTKFTNALLGVAYGFFLPVSLLQRYRICTERRLASARD